MTNVCISDNGDRYVGRFGIGMSSISSIMAFLTVHGKEIVILTTQLYTYVHTFICIREFVWRTK